MTACIASPRRIRWALLRSTISKSGRRRWLDTRLTVGDARQIALAADVPLAALYLPDPTRRELIAAWLVGRWRRLRSR